MPTSRLFAPLRIPGIGTDNVMRAKIGKLYRVRVSIYLYDQDFSSSIIELKPWDIVVFTDVLAIHDSHFRAAHQVCSPIGIGWRVFYEDEFDEVKP